MDVTHIAFVIVHLESEENEQPEVFRAYPVLDAKASHRDWVDERYLYSARTKTVPGRLRLVKLGLHIDKVPGRVLTIDEICWDKAAADLRLPKFVHECIMEQAAQGREYESQIRHGSGRSASAHMWVPNTIPAGGRLGSVSR